MNSHHSSPSLSMKACVVCTSGLPSKDRGAVRTAVSSMGGRYVDDLSRSVTHLVVGPTGVASDKHRAALKTGIHCVTEHWVFQCSDERRLVNTDSFAIMHYLSGLVICVTGENVSNDQRMGIANLVREGGGRYEANMEGGVCTHLIATEANGKKWELAQEHPGTFVVSREWLLDCARMKGVCCLCLAPMSVLTVTCILSSHAGVRVSGG